MFQFHTIFVAEGICVPAVGVAGKGQPIQPKATHVEVLVLYASKHCVVMLKMSNELAGEIIAFLCIEVIRVISVPCVVLLTSRIAELLAVAPVVLIPTPKFCENIKFIDIICTIKKIDKFFIEFVSGFYSLIKEVFNYKFP